MHIITLLKFSFWAQTTETTHVERANRLRHGTSVAMNCLELYINFHCDYWFRPRFPEYTILLGISYASIKTRLCLIIVLIAVVAESRGQHLRTVPIAHAPAAMYKATVWKHATITVYKCNSKNWRSGHRVGYIRRRSGSEKSKLKAPFLYLYLAPAIHVWCVIVYVNFFTYPEL